MDGTLGAVSRVFRYAERNVSHTLMMFAVGQTKIRYSVSLSANTVAVRAREHAVCARDIVLCCMRRVGDMHWLEALFHRSVAKRMALHTKVPMLVLHE